ncbi:glycosyltransferase family 39 protein [Granulicella sp. dw_53]|uniref:ArnT family glycosyltransferase n=1 Tax=Granulicella sp. dw_53 TaxID=2719792 RepID=UPI0021071777|nr:glycosyltransferase family 39 protein [Granulicella sp. dw_53]
MMSRLNAWMKGEDGSGGSDSSRRIQWRIFWVGLVVRLLYITLAHTYRIRLFQDHFQFGWEVGRIARAVATGYGYSDPFTGHTGPTAWCPPLYTLLLAGVFKVFGVYSATSAWVIFAIDSVFSAATASAIYEIALRCYRSQGTGRSVALWSGWLWALYPAAMQYAVHWVWDMTLTTFLFTWVLVLALRVRGIGEEDASRPRSTTIRWAVFGVLWGLICLSNSTLILFLPICGVWMLLGAAKQRGQLAPAVGQAVLAGVIFLACMAPWVWRNWTVMHAFIPTRSNLGAEMYQSVQPEHQGFPWGTTVSYFEATPNFKSYKKLGEVAYVKQQGDLADAYIRTHHRWFAELFVKRIYFFWFGVPHPVEKSLFVEVMRELNYGFLSLSGLLGLAVSIRRRVPGVWLFAWAFAVLPFAYYLITVQARFRHPLEPLIAIFSVFLFQSAEKGRVWSFRAALVRSDPKGTSGK